MEHLEDYEIDYGKLLGKGNFAIVYICMNLKTKEKQAVKCVKKSNLNGKHLEALLEQEINLHKELTVSHNANLLALLDVRRTPKSIFLFLEYCDGGSLSEYIDALGNLSERKLRILLQQLANGLRELRSRNIVHRDLKPDNILLAFPQPGSLPDFSDITFKICDFGFACALENGEQCNFFCGTPTYMAPEVVLRRSYDAKVDLWSLGCLLYKCLTGESPFSASCLAELRNLYKHSSELKPELRENVSPELRHLLLRLICFPEQRISFEEFFVHSFVQPLECRTVEQDFELVLSEDNYMLPLQKPGAVLEKDLKLSLAEPVLADVAELNEQNTSLNEASAFALSTSFVSLSQIRLTEIPSQQYVKEYGKPENRNKNSKRIPIPVPRKDQVSENFPPYFEPPNVKENLHNFKSKCRNHCVLDTFSLPKTLYSLDVFRRPHDAMNKSKQNISASGYWWSLTKGFSDPLNANLLTDARHQELERKLVYLLEVVACLQKVANARVLPLPALMMRAASDKLSLEELHEQRARLRGERFLLKFRALQLLSDVMKSTQHNIKQKRLETTPYIRKQLLAIRNQYRSTLLTCKHILANIGALQLPANNWDHDVDQWLYAHALATCKQAALDEASNLVSVSFQGYKTTHTLMHYLIEKQIAVEQHQVFLEKMRKAVEDRLDYLCYEKTEMANRPKDYMSITDIADFAKQWQSEISKNIIEN